MVSPESDQGGFHDTSNQAEVLPVVESDHILRQSDKVWARIAVFRSPSFPAGWKLIEGEILAVGTQTCAVRIVPLAGHEDHSVYFQVKDIIKKGPEWQLQSNTSPLR